MPFPTLEWYEYIGVDAIQDRIKAIKDLFKSKTITEKKERSLFLLSVYRNNWVESLL
ncbi:MAG: hypothetical protein KAS63_01740 [Candidatus Heimdallarchaeota archaeon]|nr:hypothetical protein [Candidatus Heimdallarchaeota archaeon]MCK4954056.1 hypothetical protein [Candidatus Heimdallarchaeota archaeon]